ncbi:MAG: cupin-like domain-containing protein [Myxococcota bacterium]
MAPSWQRWVADNLLRGVDGPDLVDGLVGGGVPPGLARRTVAEIAASPGLAAARESQRRANRTAQVVRLDTELRGGAVLRREAPGADEFFANDWALGRPAIFTDVIPRWHRRWTPEYLRERYGDVEVQACLGRDRDPRPDANWQRHAITLTFGEYITRVLETESGNDLYLIANNHNTARPELQSLWEDLVLPEGWFNEPKLANGSALWVGPAGTHTPLHHDTSNILFCQVYGRKRIVLAPPGAPALLDAADGVYSGMTAEQALAADLGAVEVVVEPGEALFIPVGWWHDVLALDVSVSLAINAFARPNVFSWYTPGALR